jgi:hypothetical protein
MEDLPTIHDDFTGIFVVDELISSRELDVFERAGNSARTLVPLTPTLTGLILETMLRERRLTATRL